MRHLGWTDIFRLGLVQAAIGSVAALSGSTLNRIMVVELGLPASLSGALVALYYLVQLSRPTWGWRSDRDGARSFWIRAGVALLALGALAAAFGVTLMETHFAAGLAVSVAAYLAIGAGTGAAGTTLLALLAAATPPERRAAAATITWLMMIGGIALTATGVGRLLDPYGPERLIQVVGLTGAAALAVTVLALRGIEARTGPGAGAPRERTGFRQALAETWAEPRARLFAIFVFLSMIAYFMQELILEPFAGHVFGFTPGQSTTLSGLQNGGVFAGMLTVGLAASGLKRGSLRLWTTAGCLGSAAALTAVAAAGLTGAPLLPPVFALGFFNGVFAVSAIGSMMQLAGGGGREGTRMGLWGAAQAIAAGFGGLFGAAAADAMRLVAPSAAAAYGAVFLFEAALFLAAAWLALRAVAPPAAAPCPGE